MNVYLGIDGGGTKTKITVIDENEKVLYDAVGGPSSIDTVRSSVSLKNIESLIKPFIKENPEVKFQGVFAGIGGIVFKEDCKMVENIIREIPVVNQAKFIRARNDMENALYSSNNFDYGMALICGTGMVAFGKKFNETHKSGGWGFKEGELGSAYHLGREAIRYCIRAFDGRYDKDNFAMDVARAINMKTQWDIIDIMEEYFGDRTKTARLAPIVTRHANEGNIYAKIICDKAASELALAVRGVYKYFDYNYVTLVIVGSLGNSGGYFQEKLHRYIRDMVSRDIKIIAPVLDPSLAAAIAAKRFSQEELKNDTKTQTDLLSEGMGWQ